MRGVEVTSLKAFKVRFDWALSNLLGCPCCLQ